MTQNRIQIGIEKILLALVIYFVLIFVANNQTSQNHLTKNQNEIEVVNEINPPKNSDFMILDNITIDDDGGTTGYITWSEAADLEWCSGNGSLGNPYVIENVIINGWGSTCVSIKDSTAYFIIRNCTFYNATGTSIGIELDSVSNGTIFNNSISNCYRGISIMDSTNNSILENNIINSSFVGIYLYSYCDFNNISGNIITSNGGSIGIYIHSYCDNNTVKGNEVFSHSNEGIYIYNNENNTVSDNIIYNNNIGIHIRFKGNHIVSGNNIYNSSQYGIDIYRCHNNMVFDNNITNSRLDGIYLYQSENCSFINNAMTLEGMLFSGSIIELSSHNVDTSNTVNGKILYYYNHVNDLDENNFINAGQVTLISCNNSIISNINASYGSRAISLYYCKNNTIHNNIVSYSKYHGISLLYSQNCSITNNYGEDMNYNTIYLYKSSNNTISNNEAHYNRVHGIYLVDSHNCTISDNRMYANEDYGIDLYSSSNNTVYNNTCSDGDSYGIRIYQGTLNKIIGNHIFKNTLYGIYVYTSSNNLLSMNNVSKNQQYGIFLRSGSENIVVRNNITDNVGYGVYIYDSPKNHIKNNYFINNGMQFFDDFDDLISYDIDNSNKINGKILYCYINETSLGATDFTDAGKIILINTHNSKIEDLSISNSSIGILLWYSNNNSFSNITIVNESLAFYFENSDLNNITNSNIYNNRIGIYLYSSDNTYVNSSKVSSNIENGIYYDFCSNTKILDSSISDNHNYGIYIMRSTSNTIVNNSIEDNSYGIFIDDQSQDSMIYLNYFIGNSIHAIDDGFNNKWDNGTIGNFWDNFTGKDIDDDGIGDSIYLIPGLASNSDTKPIWWDAPHVNFSFPLNFTLFGKNAPFYNITIEEGRGHTFWYEFIETGYKSYTAMSGIANENVSGFFNQGQWSLLSDGNQLIRFYINDSMGFMNTTDVVIRVDQTGPAITLIVTPLFSNGITNIQAYNTTEIITGNLLANVSLPGEGYIYPELTYQGTNLWTGSFDVFLYGSGTYTVYVNGTDKVGNVGYATPESITGDLISPTITLMVLPLFSNGITVIQAFNITEVISGSLLANVSLPGGEYIYPALTYQGGNLWNGSFDVSAYGEGSYTVYVNGSDLAGNIGYATPESITGDLTPPTITLTVLPLISNGLTVIEAYNTSEVISGSLLANVSLPGGGNYYPALTYQGGNLWNGSFDVSAYGEGSYMVNVNGSDLAGNIGYATP
ncbi:MAG: hypothetical protein EU529_13215, partial [Promethearchaeota archaeon]